MRELRFASPEQLAALRPSVIGYWAALHAIDPRTPGRRDLMAGVIASVIANVNRDVKRRIAPYEAADFMPYYQADKQASAEDARVRERQLSERILRSLGFDPAKVKKGKRRK